MRGELKCCCGAVATFTAQTTSSFEAGDVKGAYGRWMDQHAKCPALYAPKPAAEAPFDVLRRGAGDDVIKGAG